MRALFGGIGTAWMQAGTLNESVISVMDAKGRSYTVGAIDLSVALQNAGIPHDLRGRYKGTDAQPLPPAVLARLKRDGALKVVKAPYDAAAAAKDAARQDKEFSRETRRGERAKDQLVNTIEKWAKDAASDWDGDPEDADGVAPDMGDTILHDAKVRKLLPASGLSSKAVARIAAEAFADAVSKLRRKKEHMEKVERMGGMPTSALATGSLHSYSKVNHTESEAETDKPSEPAEPKDNAKMAKLVAGKIKAVYKGSTANVGYKGTGSKSWKRQLFVRLPNDEAIDLWFEKEGIRLGGVHMNRAGAVTYAGKTDEAIVNQVIAQLRPLADK